MAQKSLWKKNGHHFCWGCTGSELAAMWRASPRGPHGSSGRWQVGLTPALMNVLSIPSGPPQLTGKRRCWTLSADSLFLPVALHMYFLSPLPFLSFFHNPIHLGWLASVSDLPSQFWSTHLIPAQWLIKHPLSLSKGTHWVHFNPIQSQWDRHLPNCQFSVAICYYSANLTLCLL